MENNNVNNYENHSNFMKNMLMSIMLTALVSFISYPVNYLRIFSFNFKTKDILKTIIN